MRDRSIFRVCLEIIAIKIHNIHLNLSPCCIHRVFLTYLLVIPRLGALGGLIDGGAYIRITGIEKRSRDKLSSLIKIKLQNVMIHANGIHVNTFETEARGGLKGDLDTWIYFFVVYRYSGNPL